MLWCCGVGSLGKLRVDGDAIRIDKASTGSRERQKHHSSPNSQQSHKSHQNTAHSTTSEKATYLSSAVLRSTFRLRQLTLCALATIGVVITAVAASTPASAHHVQSMVRMRCARDLRVDILCVCRVLCAVAVSMRDMLLLAHRLQWL